MKTRGYEPGEINEIANLAFIGGGSNREISNKSPEVYLPGIVEGRGQEALEAQCVPTNPQLWKAENYRDFLQERRRLLAYAVNRFLDRVSVEGSKGAMDVATLISSGEGEHVEFKETARVNVRMGQVDKEMEKAVVKTVAGFFNAQGGVLIIGVNDAGLPTGLDRDFGTLGRRPNPDGFEQFLRTLLINSVGKGPCALVSITMPEVDGTRVCVLDVPPSPRPVFVTEGSNQFFYVRTGNTTQSMNLEDAHNYAADRFKCGGVANETTLLAAAVITGAAGTTMRVW